MGIGNLKINYRLDYSYQGERYLRVFNLPSDVLEAWDELGAQITLSSSDDSWFIQFYGQNITDNIFSTMIQNAHIKHIHRGNRKNYNPNFTQEIKGLVTLRHTLLTYTAYTRHHTTNTSA